MRFFLRPACLASWSTSVFFSSCGLNFLFEAAARDSEVLKLLFKAECVSSVSLRRFVFVMWGDASEVGTAMGRRSIRTSGRTNDEVFAAQELKFLRFSVSFLKLKLNFLSSLTDWNIITSTCQDSVIDRFNLTNSNFTGSNFCDRLWFLFTRLNEEVN